MGQPQANLAAAIEQDTKFGATINHLMISAEICENNAPIQEADGNLEQAALTRAQAANFREAIEQLQNA